MEKRFFLIVFVGLFIFSAFGQHPSQDKNWQVVFQDDFNSFNTGRWYKSHNSTHGEYDYWNPKKRNEEPQVSHGDNVYIENGQLILRTQIQDFPCPKGMGYLNCQYGGIHNYTSGAILSKTTYKYGYFEIRAKLPASSGLYCSPKLVPGE
jgi:beta-glucanase (GH16 family)